MRKYTVQEMRDGAEWISSACPKQAEMLREAADMFERCEKLRFNMIPHRRDIEIIDYILSGDAGKEDK